MAAFWLEHLVTLDVMAIATGLVLCAVAGGLVIGVTVSDWLLACTILLALSLGLSKRRRELTLLADGRRDIVAFWRSTTRICSIR